MDKQWLYFPAGYDFRPKWDKIWWKKWKTILKRTEKNWSRYIWSVFLKAAAMLLFFIFNFDHWMNVIVNFFLVIFCSLISLKLLAIFWLFVNFPGDPARLSGRGRAKGVWGRVEEYLSDTSKYVHEYSLKYLFKGGVEEEREGEGDGSWAAGVWWGWWWNMCFQKRGKKSRKNVHHRVPGN